MKTHPKSLLALLCIAAIAAVVTSCKEPEKIDKPSLKDYLVSEQPQYMSGNSYAIDGNEYAFGSVAAMMSGENLLLVGTPEEGIASAEDIFANCEEYFYGAVSPLLVGKTIDITTEKRLFTVLSTLAGAPIEGIMPDYPEEATSGEMMLSYADGKALLVGWMVLANGIELACRMECEAQLTLLEDVIYRDSEVKPLRSAFYKESEDCTALWFSPAGLEHAGELEIARWYMALTLSNSLLGENVDIAALSGNSVFAFEMVDNAETDSSFTISREQMQGATGSFMVEKIDEGVYNATVNISLGGAEYGLEFNGECVDYDFRPEVRTNYITYGKGNNKQEIDIVSATLDRTTDVWVVTLTAVDESVFTATVPEDLFSGSACGFSWSPNLTVAYKGRTYSKANGDSGTVSASFAEGEIPQLNYEFIGYDDLSCIYSGACELVGE